MKIAGLVLVLGLAAVGLAAVPATGVAEKEPAEVTAALKALRESKDWRERVKSIDAMPRLSDEDMRTALHEARKILCKSDLPVDVWLERKVRDDLDMFRPLPGEAVRTYTKDPDDLKLTVGLDAAEYRPGEPIRVYMKFENTSEKYASVPWPLGPTWLLLEGVTFGIKDLGSGKMVVEKSKFEGARRAGSYESPFCHDLRPHESYRVYACVQKVMGEGKMAPIAAGSYSLSFATDYRGIAIYESGESLKHRWDAAEVKFTVKGEPMKDPKERLASISRKVGVEDLAAELKQAEVSRERFVWGAAEGYADAELLKYLKETYPEHYKKNGGR